MRDLYYHVLTPLWTESERLVSWFGLPLLLYIFLPLLGVTAVVGRLRTFKLVLSLTLLVYLPTALWWDGVGADLLWFHQHYSSAPPSAPAKKHRIPFRQPDRFIV